MKQNGRLMKAQPITSAAFAPYGQVIEPGKVAPTLINAGLCQRFTDLATFEVIDGTIGLSLFRSQVRSLPHQLDLLERHPLGSQCFIPMGGSAYLVIVALDEAGRPGAIEAFVASPEQPVNIARNTWHGVLTPISGSGEFVVLDRIGLGGNLEEFRLDDPISIEISDFAEQVV